MHVLKSAIALIPVFGLAGAVHADNLSYTYGEVGYVNVDGETGNVNFNGDGVGLAGSLAITENAFLQAGYGKLNVDVGRSNDADFSNYLVGVGAHMPLQDNIDLVGTLNWVRVDADEAGNDNGVNVGVGLRGMATEQIEWNAGVDYTDIDSEGTFGFAVGGRYHFTPELSAGVALATDENADALTTTASLRYEMR